MEQKKDRKNQILEAALRIFVIKGYSKTTMDDIVSASNLSKGALYHYYKSKKDERWQGNNYKHYDFLSEITVENSLAKLLAQFKIKDIGEIWEKHISGIELSVNLAEKWKVFTRGMVVNDRVGSRYSMFAELQYRTNGNTELYLQYGPNNWGQYGLVNDEGFVSSGMMRKELRLIVKGWF